MAQQWRILVVEGDETLNRSIVATLAQDGYSVQGVATGGEAIKILWANEYHLVIGDRALPDADGFDLLHWVRTYTPKTRMMMLAAPGSPGRRTRALELGAVAYFEKPVDMRLLKVEVRRLLQQSGFTANLDSFDLLDVIQIINMSRKSIAMVVHTGLEEQGMLGFQEGELIWAEYGALRGEEAFFALAAYKNGTVMQQPWNGAMMPNVSQPLSRLILQALQYRTKYEAAQQLSGEHQAFGAASVDAAPGTVTTAQQLSGEHRAFGERTSIDLLNDGEIESPLDALLTEETPDDRPFVFVAEDAEDTSNAQDITQEREAVSAPPVAVIEQAHLSQALPAAQVQTATPLTPQMPQPEQSGGQIEPKPWWQESAKLPRVGRPADRPPEDSAPGTSIAPSTVRKTPAGQRNDLPSWLLDQPTQSEIEALRPSAPGAPGQIPVVPVTPAASPSPPVWRPPHRATTPRVTDALAGELADRLPAPSNGQEQASGKEVWEREPARTVVEEERVRRMQWEQQEQKTQQAQQAQQAQAALRQVPQKRNYEALVSALQTVRYALPGFIAAAVAGMDGRPIAQVAIEEVDITGLCATFSTLARGASQALAAGTWGQHEDTIITSATHHIVLRTIGNAADVFQVLVTTRESDPVESLDILATIEGAIIAAL
jgi:DNA-binding response OmpR family regulator/predicted regulator of Ras-like GTPase activity (Roadblock/LC7/MglB family)